MSILAAAATGGPLAIVTAVGGVLVSLTTVYFNNRRQAVETKTNADHITALTGQITSLGAQVLELKGENSTQAVELRLLRERLETVEEAPQSQPQSQPKPKKKKKKKLI